MIPLASPKRQYEKYKTEIDGAVNRVLESGNYILGREVTLFEQEFAHFCNVPHAVGVANGTDALFLTLKALGIGNGDEVITVPNTAIATVKAIENSGAKPVLVDIREDFLMDPTKIEEKINENTRAIMPVHLYGQACDMEAIWNVVKKHNLKIIEDCAQAHGARYRSERVPVSGIGCFSFYPTKNLGALGDGGLVLTNDKEIYDSLMKLRVYGQPNMRTYQTFGQGWNSRLDELQAAILREKLRLLDEFNKERIEHAKQYSRGLEGFLHTPIVNPYGEPVWHLYVAKSKNRKELMAHLETEGIKTGIHYPIPIHLQQGFKYLGYKEGDFPIAERLSTEIISLPIFPELEESERNKVIETIVRF